MTHGSGATHKGQEASEVVTSSKQGQADEEHTGEQRVSVSSADNEHNALLQDAVNTRFEFASRWLNSVVLRVLHGKYNGSGVGAARSGGESGGWPDGEDGYVDQPGQQHPQYDAGRGFVQQLFRLVHVNDMQQGGNFEDRLDQMLDMVVRIVVESFYIRSSEDSKRPYAIIDAIAEGFAVCHDRCSLHMMESLTLAIQNVLVCDADVRGPFFNGKPYFRLYYVLIYIVAAQCRSATRALASALSAPAPGLYGGPPTAGGSLSPGGTAFASPNASPPKVVDARHSQQRSRDAGSRGAAADSTQAPSQQQQQQQQQQGEQQQQEQPKRDQEALSSPKRVMMGSRSNRRIVVSTSLRTVSTPHSRFHMGMRLVVVLDGIWRRVIL